MANTVTGKRSMGLSLQYLFDNTNGTTTENVSTGSLGTLPLGDVTWTYGTGANQINAMTYGVQTISAGSNVDLDLYGSLTDPKGQTINFTGIKEIYIAVQDPDGTKKCRVGNAATNAFVGPFSSGGTVDVYNSQDFINPSASGWGLTNSSSDKLRLANPGAGAITVHYVILGIQ